MKRVKIGIIGCGEIASAYLSQLTTTFSSIVEIAACADLLGKAAEARAVEFKIPKACTPNEMFGDPEIEIIVNLTNPPAHFSVNKAALEAGKHVFTEKPLGVTREEGRQTLELATKRGLRLSGAAETLLGAGLQKARKLLDEGAIGTPIAAMACIGLGPIVERYFLPGYGPMLDMGPYYIGALVGLLGPVRRVCGSAQIPFAEKPHPDVSLGAGSTFKVRTPSNIAAVLDFQNGVVATLITTAEYVGYYPFTEIIGTHDVLTLSDANIQSGPMSLRSGGKRIPVEITGGFQERGRGIGVAEMAHAIREGRPHRISGEMIYHVLDVMVAVEQSSQSGRHVTIESTCERPAPFELSSLLRVEIRGGAADNMVTRCA